MPTEIATIEWLAMGSADLSPFLPYYTAAITDTLPAYQLGTTVHNEDSAYWAFRSVAALSVSAESRDLAAVNVKQYWTNYVDSLVKAQETVDKKMTELYNTDPSAVSAKATNLGMAVADEAISIAKEIQSELLARIARGNGKITAIRGAGYTPTRLTKESYSSYSFDMTYEEPVVITQDTVDQLTAAADAATNEAAIAKAEAEAAQKEAAAAKAAQAELQAKLDAAGNGTPAVTTIKTNKKAYTLKKGKKVTIKVTTTNDDGKKVTFKSSKKSVAKITAKGVVKGVKKGTATITITCNGVSKKVKVTVK
jgi:FKBP-type peptidyl-prolyl cis-trans isomerase